jgi:hypothetical protein
LDQFDAEITSPKEGIGVPRDTGRFGVGVGVTVGVKVGVNVGVGVGVSVGEGVCVTVGIGVTVGPNNPPGPQPETEKLRTKMRKAIFRLFVFIFSPAPS